MLPFVTSNHSYSEVKYWWSWKWPFRMCPSVTSHTQLLKSTGCWYCTSVCFPYDITQSTITTKLRKWSCLNYDYYIKQVMMIWGRMYNFMMHREWLFHFLWCKRYFLGSVPFHSVFFFAQVPLGVLLKSETKHEDMISIMTSLQQYTPLVTYTTNGSTGEEVEVRKHSL